MKIELLKKFGLARKGDIYIKGLHPMPKHYREFRTMNRDSWCWKEGTKPGEEHYLSTSFFTERNLNKDYKILD